jgi:NAD(P)-dependent dehydrogenase (short-subunit alcohol dehydrogenase family)
LNSTSHLALVTGGNRGIGLEIARQLAGSGLRVVIGVRDAAKGQAAAEDLNREGTHPAVAVAVMDVADPASIAAAAGSIEQQHGPISILINNAGILIDGPGGFDSSLFDMTDETMRLTWQTNVLGPAALIRVLVPGMIQRNFGRVVNVSSGAGQLSDMGSGFPAYRMSKSALNALTRVSSAEVSKKAAGGPAGGNVKINAMCPGWVRTAMGGPDAPRTPAQGAETAYWLATLSDDGPTGGFFRDKTAIAW